MRKNGFTGRRLGIESLECRRLLAVLHVDASFAADDPDEGEFKTISAAVSAASAGDKIKVAPGTYSENVVVNKQLKIVGAGADEDEALDPTEASILDPVSNAIASAPAVGFELAADGIVIKGFTIAESGTDIDADGTVGIRTSASFSGYKIEENVIQDNTVGIYLNTATTESGSTEPDETEVEANVIRDNNRTGTNTGNGIFSDLGLQNVEIKDNHFSGENNDASIKIVAAGTEPNTTTLRSDIEIKKNDFESLTGAGIYFEEVVDSEIKKNDFQDVGASAIQLNGGNLRVTISRNDLEKVGTDDFDGIILNSSSQLGSNQHNVIEKNEIEGAGLSGIVIRDSANNTIKKNKIKLSQLGGLEDTTAGNGISLENADNNTIKKNKVKENARNGIFLDAQSTGNTVEDNKSKDNNTGNVGAFDYTDLSTGGDGPSGRQNEYDDNKGGTENVTGLIDDFI